MSKICFCNHCGNKNPAELKKCQYCNKEIINRRVLFFDYLLDEVKDDADGKMKDKLFDKIKYLIKKYIYGIVFSVTVISSVVINVAIRVEDKDKMIESSPIITVKNYDSVNDTIKAIEKYIREGNVNALYEMLYQYNYPEEAKRLGINALDSELFNHVEHNALKEAEFSSYLYEEGEEYTIDKYCKVRDPNSGLACLKTIDVSNTNHKFYNTNILGIFYSYEIETDEIKKGDKTFMGQDDFEIFLVEADGNYYLADVFDNHADINIVAAGGDISKLDYQTQMDIYVGRPVEEE